MENFQRRHGLEADGIVGQATLAALNVPVEQHIDQIRVNLERPLRIIIVYGTARAEDGRVHFRPDIYQRDAAVLAALNGEFRVRREDLTKRLKDR